MRLLSAAFTMFFAVATSGCATSEIVGGFEAPRQEYDILDDLGAKPLRQVGGDVIRFSMQPALGGDGLFIQANNESDRAEVIVRRARGHPGFGWEQTSSYSFSVTAKTFDDLTKEADEYFDRGDGEWVVGVCSDGPGFRSERLKDGEVTWLEGFCGDHPNNEIGKLMFDLVKNNLGHELSYLNSLWARFGGGA